MGVIDGCRYMDCVSMNAMLKVQFCLFYYGALIVESSGGELVPLESSTGELMSVKIVSLFIFRMQKSF